MSRSTRRVRQLRLVAEVDDYESSTCALAQPKETP